MILAVVVLLALQAILAVSSLVEENPTIDEVIHMPAGLTYWQTGTFRLYHHNPPLVKLIAALPVLASGVEVDYASPSWRMEPPNKAAFAHEFMQRNASQYFEIFTRARLLMPLFGVLGGLAVFGWSRALHGNAAGLLSLALWSLCPNILAHTRLVTTDAGAAAIGILATWFFWRYLRNPTWRAALLAGLCLGIAQLTKFSLVVLYGFWPVLALAFFLAEPSRRKTLGRTLAQGASIVALSVIVIDVGYGFEGVGTPLGDLEFTCQTLTKPTPPGMKRPQVADPLYTNAYRFRVNRFRDTLLGRMPIPVPSHCLLGFDDQKLEAEGIPAKFFDLRLAGSPEGERVLGYPVFLDGELRQRSWWYYYAMTLLYKVPEGTWLLVVGSLVVLVLAPWARGPWPDEFAVLFVPACVLLVMSVFTNINLGLRYVLPALPYLYVSTGKLAPWAAGLPGRWARRAAMGFVGASTLATGVSTLMIHPHYLAYFNRISGGPDRGADHLIDSNIDWGQDLVGLMRWLGENAPDERLGLAYFGQINPEIFNARGQRLDWFLPPPRPGTMSVPPPRYQNIDPRAPRLEPGLYAVSASLVKGLPWRVYDSPWNSYGGKSWLGWSAGENAFSYFGLLRPVAKVGYSIWIYRVTPEDAARLARIWSGSDG